MNGRAQATEAKERADSRGQWTAMSRTRMRMAGRVTGSSRWLAFAGLEGRSRVHGEAVGRASSPEARRGEGLHKSSSSSSHLLQSLFARALIDRSTLSSSLALAPSVCQCISQALYSRS